MRTSRGNSARVRMPGRRRRLAGRVLLVAGMLVACLWLASGRWTFWYAKGLSPTAVSGTRVVASQGVLELAQARDPRPFDQLSSWWLCHSNPAFELQWMSGRSVHLGTGDGGCGMAPRPRRVVVNAGVGGYYESFSQYRVLVDIWAPALALLSFGGVLVLSAARARRRAMSGVCAKCGYDLAGLAAEGLCPECGHARMSA